MSSFFESFGKRLTQTSQNAYKKGKGLADSAKLSSQISDEQKQVQKLYTQLGKEYFELNSGDPQEELAGTVGLILKSLAEIEDLKKARFLIRGIAICPECNAEQSLANAFCSGCGAKMPEVELDELDAERMSASGTEIFKCPVCGKPANEELAFCTFCGKDFSEAPANPSSRNDINDIIHSAMNEMNKGGNDGDDQE